MQPDDGSDRIGGMSDAPVLVFCAEYLLPSGTLEGNYG
jgi:hypothetical protein